MLRKTFPVGPLQCNCTILVCEQSKDAVVIDPGDDAPTILEAIGEMGANIKAIVHTHAHIDHVGATFDVAKTTGAPTYLHNEDVTLHQMLETQAQMLGLPMPSHGPMDHDLPEDLSISFGLHELGTLHTPGHKPGSVCFCVPGEDLCFSGDTLFRGSIGRTDLWGGDFDTIEQSIKNKLYNLNGAVEVIPGHGPNTTIDFERSENPFVKG